MSLLFLKSRNPSAAALRERILNVLPSGSFQMQKLLSVFDIRSDRSIPTACIECKDSPALIFNPDFVAEHCRQDGDLFLLVMHELYHHILGHTRLFPKVTLLDNIVFDALINALLCRQFHASAGTGLFTRLYQWERMPETLLRPPPDWDPSAVNNAAVHALPAAEARVMRALYLDPAQTATARDLHRLLREFALTHLTNLSASCFSGIPLLGGHDTAWPDDHPLLSAILREMTRNWPDPAVPLQGRSDGGRTRSWGFPGSAAPDGEFLKEVRRLLRRCEDHVADTRDGRRVKVESSLSIGDSFLPCAGDRRAAAIRAVTGSHPLIWRRPLEFNRPIRRARRPAHVYLDVSGSMGPLIGAFTAALRRPVRSGRLRLFVFSTIVDRVRSADLASVAVQNTNGTDINCVLRHLAELPASTRPDTVLVLSDGQTGPPAPGLLAALGGIRFLSGVAGASARQHELGWTDATILPETEPPFDLHNNHHAS